MDGTLDFDSSHFTSQEAFNPNNVTQTVDIESFWMADYAGQIPNRGLWLAILLLWL